MKVLFMKIPRWYAVFAAGIFLIIAVLAGVAAPAGVVTPALKPQPFYQGSNSEPKVAFACNVFWGEEFLPSMLESFEKHGIKITFFIGGSWAKRYPDSLRNLAQRGHELGNHSYSHPHPNSIGKQKNMEQIKQTENLIKEITGIKTNLYAPPYGEYNDTVLAAAHELGYRTTMWSIDTIDWQRPAADVIVNRVIKKLHNGAIILMHPTESTAKALPRLIQEIQNRGYKITTVSDVLG